MAEMTRALGGMEQDSVRFPHALQNAARLKFMSRIFHLILLDRSWQQGSETADKGTAALVLTGPFCSQKRGASLPESHASSLDYCNSLLTGVPLLPLSLAVHSQSAARDIIKHNPDTPARTFP